VSENLKVKRNKRTNNEDVSMTPSPYQSQQDDCTREDSHGKGNAKKNRKAEGGGRKGPRGAKLRASRADSPKAAETEERQEEKEKNQT